MCGIMGTVDKHHRAVTEVLNLIERAQHRGPDAVGVYVDGVIRHGRERDDLSNLPSTGAICLGHSRLTIVGGEDAGQPIRSRFDRLALVHNGEIYNYAELFPLLKRDPCEPCSDSAVLLDLIEEFYEGDLLQAVKQAMPFLDGMYAFAVTDGNDVVLARDPIGKKPVYYVDGFPFYFASETKALRDLGRDILRLNPGSILKVGKAGLEIHEGYRIEKPAICLTDMEVALERYSTAFHRSIKKRTRGLDHAAVLFSGGVDSGLVAQGIRAQGIPVVGYCVGVEDSSDMLNARESSRAMGLELHTTILTDELVEKVLPDVIEAIELNGVVQVGAAVPMYLAAKMAAQEGHKVMFTGQGADELFGGYAWYRNVVQEAGHLNLHTRLWEDILSLYLDTLEREDRMTMAHGLELRAPFLDRDLIRAAMQMSPELKVKNGADQTGKRVHRDFAVRCGVPKFIAEGQKVTAQHGSAIPDILSRLAKKHFRGRMVPSLSTRDYGSNYRYFENGFGTSEAVAYLAEITNRHQIHLLNVESRPEITQ